MDKEQIRKALDHFENDEFMAAKDILKSEIKTKRDEFLQDRLSLKEALDKDKKKKKDEDEDEDEMDESSKEDAKKTLDAIIGSTKDDGGDVYKMAIGMRKSYEKNGGFSKQQAQWIFKTSQALFKK